MIPQIGMEEGFVAKQFGEGATAYHMLKKPGITATSIGGKAGGMVKPKLHAEEQEELDNKLFYAIKNDNPALVGQLLGAGANPNVGSDGNPSFYWTPLMHVAANEDTTIAKILIEHGADVNAKDNSGQTALMVAAKYGQASMAKFLLKHGADAHAVSNFGETAFSLASDKSIVKILGKGAEKGKAGATQPTFHGHMHA